VGHRNTQKAHQPQKNTTEETIRLDTSQKGTLAEQDHQALAEC
jgi:hypothetical protein